MAIDKYFKENRGKTFSFDNDTILSISEIPEKIAHRKMTREEYFGMLRGIKPIAQIGSDDYKKSFSLSLRQDWDYMMAMESRS